MKKGVYVFVLVCLGFFSCQNSYDPVLPHTKKIYPLGSRSEKIFYVVDTIFDTPLQIGYESLRYFKKEVPVELEVDLMNRTVYPRRIYTALDSLDSLGGDARDFQYQFTWSYYKNDSWGERREENIRYQILNYPVVENGKWDGNLYNDESAQIYSYQSVDTTIWVNGIPFSNCVFVLQVPYRRDSFTSYIHEEHAFEVYAPDVGLIERYYKFYEKQGTSPPATGSRILHEIMVDYIEK